MIAKDFVYAGIQLSSLGYMICSFDGGGVETVQSGSQISLNTVPVQDGRIHNLTSTTYEETIETTFQICKANCVDVDDFVISVPEMRALLRWLNSKVFQQFAFISDQYGFYFDATFNVGKIVMDDKIVGLELTMLTNSPFAYSEATYVEGSYTSNNRTINVSDDVVEYLYPEEVRIELSQSASGTLNLKCYLDSQNYRTVTITGCTSGETITIKRPTITSVVQPGTTTHDIASAFNWEFPVLVSSPTLLSDTTANTWNTNLSCKITINYRSLRKVIL